MSGDFPEVRYADAHGVSIAYSVRGGVPIHIVRVPGLLGSILASTVDPVIDADYEHLGGFARLIQVDRRGLGMSDPLIAGGAPPLEQQVEDILAVMDTVGSRPVALYADVVAGTVALAFAAMHPERVSALVSQQRVRTAIPRTRLSIRTARRRLRPPSRGGPIAMGRSRPSSLARERLAEPSRRSTLPAHAGTCAAGEREPSGRGRGNGGRHGTRRARRCSDSCRPRRSVLCPADRDIEGDDLEVLGTSGFWRITSRTPASPCSRDPTSISACTRPRSERGSRSSHRHVVLLPRAIGSRDRLVHRHRRVDEQPTELGDQAWRTRLDQHDAMVHTQLERFRRSRDQHHRGWLPRHVRRSGAAVQWPTRS